jgi:hypothetical protein
MGSCVVKSAPKPESLPEGQRPDKLTTAAMRRARPLKLWAGKGHGAPCDHCRVLIAPSDVEYEVDAELDGARITLFFHQRCHDAWQAGQDQSSPS